MDRRVSERRKGIFWDRFHLPTTTAHKSSWRTKRKQKNGRETNRTEKNKRRVKNKLRPAWRPAFLYSFWQNYYMYLYVRDFVFLFPLNLCVTIDWISNNCLPCFATSAGMIFTLSYLNSRSNFTWKSSYLYVSKFSIVYTSSTFLLLKKKYLFVS